MPKSSSSALARLFLAFFLVTEDFSACAPLSLAGAKKSLNLASFPLTPASSSSSSEASMASMSLSPSSPSINLPASAKSLNFRISSMSKRSGPCSSSLASGAGPACSSSPVPFSSSPGVALAAVPRVFAFLATTLLSCSCASGESVRDSVNGCSEKLKSSSPFGASDNFASTRRSCRLRGTFCTSSSSQIWSRWKPSTTKESRPVSSCR
mmetsp:Transcript_81237/g.230117  ORF Transcript_81237/g.230117 Transcript_81237/m.230117 type:complete len:209 (-) Transcript_81237:333-959(-)